MQTKMIVNGNLVSSRPRAHTSQYMLYEGKHKGIVDEIIFMLPRFYSDKTKANLKLMNPLAGILIRAKCKSYDFIKDTLNVPILHSYLTKTSQVCNVKSAVLKDVADAVAHALNCILMILNENR